MTKAVLICESSCISRYAICDCNSTTHACRHDHVPVPDFLIGTGGGFNLDFLKDKLRNLVRDTQVNYLNSVGIEESYLAQMGAAWAAELVRLLFRRAV